ncbi:MAG: phage tail sheath C-terminal domain-containing protein [Blastocatellia bacterium]
MPEYLSPGVYVEEVSSGIRPIEGVGTSTGAFIGIAEKGPIGGARYEDGPGRPVLVTNFGDFTRAFGGFINGEFLAYAVQQFFAEGGTRCYVTRTAHFADPSDPSTLSAMRASVPLGGIRNTLAADLAAPAGPGTPTTVATLTSAAGIETGMVLFISDGTNSHRATVSAVAGNAVTITSMPVGSPTIRNGATVTQVVLNVNAINEGAWGNNLRVAVDVSGQVSTTLDGAIAVDATKAVLTSLLGIRVGMTLFISGGGSATRVQVTRIEEGARRITFRGLTAVPAIATGANVTGVILGKASTVLRNDAAAGATEAVLESAEGVTVGSILLFVSQNVTTGVETLGRVVVNRVTGNRVFLAAPGLTAAFPAGTSVSTEDFTITVYNGDDIVETHTDLSMENTNSIDYVENRINLSATRSRYIRVSEAPLVTGNFPPTRTASPHRLGSIPGTEGINGADDEAGDYVGNEAVQTGFHAFDTVDGINILSAPGITLRPVILAGMTYCENRADVFYVAETSPAALTATDALDFKNATGSFAGQQAFNSKYGAIYWPWIRVLDPITNRTISMPPSGAIVGSYSATDVRRGVHKAPAGIEDGFLNTAIGIERVVTKGEHDVLNPQGINVIRTFPGLGIVIWGARTVSKDPEWRYVNVRRLFLFLEESIDEGTQWAVFEPNDPTLWARITRNVSAFLRIQWLEGKLVGNKPEEAFFVKCNEETNPPESVDLGRVITIIGVAPSKPAEFVIFRIMQKRPGADA